MLLGANSFALPLLPAIPLAVGLLLLLAPGIAGSAARKVAMGGMLLVALLAWIVGLPDSGPLLWKADWIPSLGVQLLLGVDGLSLPLVLLTASLCPLALLAAWDLDHKPRLFCSLLLILESGMLGVFVALDFVVLYVFWELMLAPMFFLIALWGGSERLKAAVKYFAFTLVGSLLMLAAGLIAYGYSDLTKLPTGSLAAAGVLGPEAATLSGDREAALAAQQAWLDSEAADAGLFSSAEKQGQPLRTFNLLALAEMGLSTRVFQAPITGGLDAATLAFLLIFTGLAIKLPAAPLHTWLPDAHVQAPTPVSMLLAGVLLKLGGYGMVRIAWPLFPNAAAEFAGWVAAIGALGIVWGALVALAQTDFKKVIAYSSVSHMGFLLVGLSAGATASGWTADQWRLGASGAVYQMVAHGITSAGLFFAVGMIYERLGHRDLLRMGGLMNAMPLSGGLTLLLILASLGLPGLCGFVGEILALFGAWDSHPWTVAFAAAGTVLVVGYSLRALQLAYFGPMSETARASTEWKTTAREAGILAPLAVAAILLGVFPQGLLSRIDSAIAPIAQDMQALSSENKLAIQHPRLSNAGRDADHAH